MEVTYFYWWRKPEYI